MTWTTTQQDEDAALVRCHGLARGVNLVTAHDHAGHAQAQRAQSAGDERLSSIQLQVVHVTSFKW